MFHHDWQCFIIIIIIISFIVHRPSFVIWRTYWVTNNFLLHRDAGCDTPCPHGWYRAHPARGFSSGKRILLVVFERGDLTKASHWLTSKCGIYPWLISRYGNLIEGNMNQPSDFGFPKWVCPKAGSTRKFLGYHIVQGKKESPHFHAQMELWQLWSIKSRCHPLRTGLYLQIFGDSQEDNQQWKKPKFGLQSADWEHQKHGEHDQQTMYPSTPVIPSMTFALSVEWTGRVDGAVYNPIVEWLALNKHGFVEVTGVKLIVVALIYI